MRSKRDEVLNYARKAITSPPENLTEEQRQKWTLNSVESKIKEVFDLLEESWKLIDQMVFVIQHTDHSRIVENVLKKYDEFKEKNCE